ncbi:hypothetical protein MFIFM68171_06714 [Madurella fahalii]|uniref:Uncharacterized protein n=1 Tax=Madurella fahalii TaxID=1157608 RepID=A0ABQ0GFJ2_9PEZI
MLASPSNMLEVKPIPSVDSTSSSFECNKDKQPPQPFETAREERATLEEPKRIADSLRKSLLKRWLFVHFSPVTVMYFMPLLYYYGPSWRPNGIQLGWFLFAAKIYEALIVTSLADILMYHIRYALTRSSHGVPFGVLTAPYQISNTLYLFDRPFTASLMSRRRMKEHTVLLILIFVSFVLVMLAGPSCGTVLLPTVDWRAVGSSEFQQLRHNRGNISGPDQFQIFIGRPTAALFPDQVLSRGPARSCCTGLDLAETRGLLVNTTREALHTTGISQIVGFVLGALSFLRLDDPFDTNFTMYHDGLLRDISIGTALLGNDIAMATTTLGPVTGRLPLASAVYLW